MPSYPPEACSAPVPTEQLSPIHIIPQPLTIQVQGGSFEITPQTRLVCPLSDKDLKFTADYLRSVLRTATGYSLRIFDVAHRPPKNFILLAITPNNDLGGEGYTLHATSDSITLEGGGAAGTFYAVQTVLQLLPPEVYSLGKSSLKKWALPSVTITDKPRYGWRGMMLDVSRHFFPKAFIKKFIDFLAIHKLNTFHWHLCDDQGWRVEIKKYPRLTTLSAWRADREGMNWNVRPPQKPGERATYGGFYTQKDLREIVRYAADRHITIVPEIEMPAHATSVIAAYPELSCTGGPFTVPTGSLWPIKDIYCAGNDSVFSFLQNVLTEVAAIFPGKYIHIGGDEADKTEWKRCPKCQARIKAEGLKDEGELQSYFVKRIEKILVAQGKRMIGWDEILEGGLPPEATVMSWRGIAGGIEAAKANHDVVMAPTSNCYIDYYQGDWRVEPVAIGGFVPISTVYAYEPTPDTLTADQAKHILGTQANLWAEFLFDPAKVEYMAFPRIAAIAEVGWSAKERREWNGFAERLGTQMNRYAARNINTAKSAFNVTMIDSFDVNSWTRIIKLEAEIGQDRIHYTLDGTAPTSTSLHYEGPISLTNGAVVSARTFAGRQALGDLRRKEFFITPKWVADVKLLTPLDAPYTGVGPSGLVDNQRAETGSKDKQWHGVKGKDLAAVVDLGTIRPLRKLAAGFYHSSTELIFLPSSVTFEVSSDGIRFRRVALIRSGISPKTQQPLMKDFTAAFPRTNARYIRISAASLVRCPKWHNQRGELVWLLADEFFVE